MLDNFRALGLFSLAELNYLRSEAMDLFERCLTEGSPDFLMAFIERQIVHEPPRLDVLHELAEDLHQRLLSLRESHFDAREQVLRTLRSDFDVDLSPLTPASALHIYHQMNADNALQFISHHNPRLTHRDQLMLRQLLDASLELAAQLHDDIRMTEGLFTYVTDWTFGLSAVSARRTWLNDWDEQPTGIH
jgi:hypothetical protein